MKRLLILFLLSSVLVFSNCNDELEDLTIEIVGNYTGAFGNNTVGEINPYEISVERVDGISVRIAPVSGTAFDAFEAIILRTNETTIITPSNDGQPLEFSVIFSLGTTTSMTMSLDPTGEAHTFVGEMQ